LTGQSGFRFLFGIAGKSWELETYRMKWALMVACLVTLAFGQTKKPAPSCKAQLQDSAAYIEMLRQQVADLRVENESVKKELADTKQKSDAEAQKGEQIRSAAADVLKFNQQLFTEFQKVTTQRDDAVTRYNQLLSRANNALADVNARLSRQNQIANAFAIYSMMPKYTPPPLQMPSIPQSLNMNCTTSTIGTTSYTNCH
jgi:uncharacterized protein YukE